MYKMSYSLWRWYFPALWQRMSIRTETLHQFPMLISTHRCDILYILKEQEGAELNKKRDRDEHRYWKRKQIGRRMDRWVDVDEFKARVWSTLWLTGPEPSGADWAIHKSAIVLFINQTPLGQVTFPLYTHTHAHILKHRLPGGMNGLLF